MELTTSDFYDYFSKHNIKQFRGVYTADIIKDIKINKTPRYQYFIFNSDSFNGNGLHWICLCIDQKQKRAFYYDSFSFPPMEQIYKWAKGYDIYYSSTQMQPNKSILCGMYCIATIMKYHQTKSFSDAIYSFPNPFKPSIKNEKYVMQIYNS